MNLSKIRGFSAFTYTWLISQSFCQANATEYPFVEVIEYNANNPIEDRHSYVKLKSINGFAASVFDGHGGYLTVILILFSHNTLPKICISFLTIELERIRMKN
jgi:hypothetical protein